MEVKQVTSGGVRRRHHAMRGVYLSRSGTNAANAAFPAPTKK